MCSPCNTTGGCSRPCQPWIAQVHKGAAGCPAMAALTCASSASSSSSYRLEYLRRFLTISFCFSSDSREGGRGRQLSWKKRSCAVLRGSTGAERCTGVSKQGAHDAEQGTDWGRTRLSQMSWSADLRAMHKGRDEFDHAQAKHC